MNILSYFILINGLKTSSTDKNRCFILKATSCCNPNYSWGTLITVIDLKRLVIKTLLLHRVFFMIKATVKNTTAKKLELVKTCSILYRTIYINYSLLWY